VSHQYNYRYAIGKDNMIVDILSLSQKDRNAFAPYSCASCKQKMGTRMGNKNRWHFYHLSNPKNCSIETYLHASAKKIFAQTYRQSLEKQQAFNIILPIERQCLAFQDFINGFSCSSHLETHKKDLTLTFNQVNVEQFYQGFKPDILLSSMNNSDVIFIEIVVTHKSSPNKIASGHKIVELQISSEDDLEKLYQPYIDTTLPSTTLHNFEKKSLPYDCLEQCEQYISIFLVKKNQICTREDIKGYKIKNKIDTIKKDLQCYIIDSSPTKGRDLYEDNMFFAISSGINIKNCNLCIHVKGRKTGQLCCDIYKKRVLQNDAQNCKNYTINYELDLPYLFKPNIIHLSKQQQVEVSNNQNVNTKISPKLPFFEE